MGSCDRQPADHRHASMGPQTIARGNVRVSASTLGATKLQWGCDDRPRKFRCTAGCPCDRTRFNGAVDGGGCLHQLSRTGFNGAADDRPRKSVARYLSSCQGSAPPATSGAPDHAADHAANHGFAMRVRAKPIRVRQLAQASASGVRSLTPPLATITVSRTRDNSTAHPPQPAPAAAPALPAPGDCSHDTRRSDA
jgi:hypothetical protein